MDNLIQNSECDSNIAIFDTTMMQKISKNFHFVMFICDIKGIILNSTDNISTILGYLPKNVVEKKIFYFFHEMDRREIEKAFTTFSFQQKDYKLSCRIKKNDHSYIWVDFTILGFDSLTESSNPEKIICTVKEIPLENDEYLMQSDKLSVIGQLAAGIAHEIRNPLTSLKGFIQLMKSDLSFKEHYLKIMETEIDIIETISKELMALAKPNQANYKSCNLIKIYENCMTLLEGEIFQNRIQVIQKIISDPVEVFCDEHKIKQVLINIIKNALEAMDGPGKIVITIEKNNQFGMISILDEGKGISEEQMNQLGKPFFTTKRNGNGLGLMMSYKIIEEHKGKIDVKSKLGKGTRFKIYLPLDTNK